MSDWGQGSKIINIGWGKVLLTMILVGVLFILKVGQAILILLDLLLR